MNDQLEQRLRAADPMPPSVPVDSARSPRARTLVERTMTDALIPVDEPRADRSHRWLLAAAAAAVVGLVGVGVAVAGGGDDEPTSVALTAPGGDAAMGMCIQVTPESLRDASELAFSGTVTALDGTTATIEVDHWYAGGDADQVVVTGPTADNTALLGGVPLEDGSRYLISAGDGEVRSCGLSGPVSPELEALYDAAFGG